MMLMKDVFLWWMVVVINGMSWVLLLEKECVMNVVLSCSVIVIRLMVLLVLVMFFLFFEL